jgi:SSS family transporter
MNSTWVYTIVLLLYFGVLLAIGFITRIKTKSTTDYHIGGRNIGAFVSAFSFVSAYYSSVVIIGGGGFGYKYGMATIWIGAINVLVGCFLAWAVLGKRARKLSKKLNAITIPDFFGKLYNSNFLKTFSALIISIFLVIYNVSILKGLGNTFEVILNIPYLWGLIISGAIVLIYVSLGGYFAVVWTGFIQGLIMIFGLILLLFVTLSKVGGLAAGAHSLGAIDRGFVETPGIWGLPGLLSYALVVSLGVWGMPQMLVRFYSIKSDRAIKTGTLLATIGGAMAIIPYLVGALSRVLYPGIANADLAIPTLVKGIMPPISGSIFFAAVIAAGMSTFSAVLIILVGSLIRDLAKDSFGAKLSDKREIFWCRISNLLVGIISIIIAVRPPGLVLVLTAFSWAVIASTCLAPFLMGLYWRGVTRAGAISAMVGGAATSLLWMALKQPFGLHGFIPGIIVSFLLIIVISCLTPRKMSPYQGI